MSCKLFCTVGSLVILNITAELNTEVLPAGRVWGPFQNKEIVEPTAVRHMTDTLRSRQGLTAFGKISNLRFQVFFFVVV